MKQDLTIGQKPASILIVDDVAAASPYRARIGILSA